MANRPKRRRAPQPSQPQTLSMDWFTDRVAERLLIHTLKFSVSPLNNPPLSSSSTSIYTYTSGELLHQGEVVKKGDVENSLAEAIYEVEKWITDDLQADPRGCHSSLAEHEEMVAMCARTMGKCGIRHPQQFLELWTTSEILEGLDRMIGMEMEGIHIDNPGGWLWAYLSSRERPRDEER